MLVDLAFSFDFPCLLQCLRQILTKINVQVAVALSHAAILEESMRARNLLMEQNVALNLARQEAELAIRARNDFLAVMNHELGTPLHAIITLSSLLLETELNPEQRSMVETVLKSSSLLETLINDILDLSKLEDGNLELELGAFNLHSVFREVIDSFPIFICIYWDIHGIYYFYHLPLYWYCVL